MNSIQLKIFFLLLQIKDKIKKQAKDQAASIISSSHLNLRHILYPRSLRTVTLFLGVPRIPAPLEHRFSINFSILPMLAILLNQIKLSGTL
jgi:hypothetical protein